MTSTRGSASADDRPVLVVATLRRTGMVGVQTHIGAFSDLLRRRRLPAHVVGLDSRMPFLAMLLLAPCWVIRRLRIRAAAPFDWRATLKAVQLAVRREFTTSPPRLVYAQDTRSACAALSERGEQDAPVVLVVHYNESEAEEFVQLGVARRGSAFAKRLEALERDVLRRLDGLVFVSDYMRRHIHELVPETVSVPSVVLPNFLDPRVDDGAHPLDAGGDLITVGMLVERKNHAFLLQVLAAAARMGHRYTLTVVGDGPDRTDLQRLARELGVEQQVRFLGQRRDVDALLRQHRLYVHSARMENCPFAVIEAFRAGLPVIAAPVGGVPEVIGGDGAGWFWDLEDVERAAAVLVEALEDPAGLAAAAAMARKRFEEHFSEDVVERRLLGFLESVQRRQHV